MPLLKILAGPDGKDRGCIEFELGDPDEVRVDKLKVISVEGNNKIPVSDDLVSVQRKCAEKLKELGASVETLEIEGLKDSLAIWSSMLASAGEMPFGVQLGLGRPISPVIEFIKWIPGVSPHTLPAIGLAAIEDFLNLLPLGREKSIEKGLKLKEELTKRRRAGMWMVY